MQGRRLYFAEEGRDLLVGSSIARIGGAGARERGNLYALTPLVVARDARKVILCKRYYEDNERMYGKQ